MLFASSCVVCDLLLVVRRWVSIVCYLLLLVFAYGLMIVAVRVLFVVGCVLLVVVWNSLLLVVFLVCDSLCVVGCSA